MDKLIFSLYNKDIIKLKNTTLKNGCVTPVYIDFIEIFGFKKLLNKFLENLVDFINNNFDYEEIVGYNEISKNLCLLINYKYNINYNLKYDFKKGNNIGKILLIKENYGIDKKKNIENILFLIKYSTIKNINKNHKYFFDSIYILNILYQNNILNYEKYFSLFRILDYDNNSKILNYLYDTNKNCKIIFDTSIIDKLDIKDFIKTINHISPHISVLKINLKLFKTNLKSVIKLLIHHNIKILDYLEPDDITNLNIIFSELNQDLNNYLLNLINILDLLKNRDINIDTIIFDDINIKEFDSTKINLFNYYKQKKKILGFITQNEDYYFEDKLKIGYYKNGDNIEKKILIDKYDFLITNNVNNIINLKQLTNNLTNN